MKKKKRKYLRFIKKTLNRVDSSSDCNPRFYQRTIKIFK